LREDVDALQLRERESQRQIVVRCARGDPIGRVRGAVKVAFRGVLRVAHGAAFRATFDLEFDVLIITIGARCKQR